MLQGDTGQVKPGMRLNNTANWGTDPLVISLPRYDFFTSGYLFSEWLKQDDTWVKQGEEIARVSCVPMSYAVDRLAGVAASITLQAPTTGFLWLDKSLAEDTNVPLRAGDIIACVLPWRDGAPLAHSKKHDAQMLFQMRRHSSIGPVREPPEEIRAALAALSRGKAEAAVAKLNHGIFISYRRSDQAAFAGRLYDHLVNVFDKSTIFMDVDSIDLGLDFVEVLPDALGKCRVVIVVIGQGWLSATDELGAPRLENTDDFVRLEVEVALQRGLRVIPVLVDGAPMPKSTSLPESMAPLARRNGREISNARFGSDTIELINTLRRILGRDAEA